MLTEVSGQEFGCDDAEPMAFHCLERCAGIIQKYLYSQAMVTQKTGLIGHGKLEVSSPYQSVVFLYRLGFLLAWWQSSQGQLYGAETFQTVKQQLCGFYLHTLRDAGTHCTVLCQSKHSWPAQIQGTRSGLFFPMEGVGEDLEGLMIKTFYHP